ncbi:MAG TPA: hypothetical protein VEK07_20155 [Polyangiaceae bacterium]|nr:hypothetical protein [Polyangiaceae bacterium]
MRFLLSCRRARPSWLNAWAVALGVVGGASWVGVAGAQACAPGTYSCGDGTCCPVTDVCCVGVQSACCSDDTPYCCDDGTCAISPSACASSGAATDAGCPAYAIPCGAGCVPAGGDCCDEQGHFCPGTETCISATTCSTGDASVPAELATGTAPTMSSATSPSLSPLQDPPGVRREACTVDPGPAAPRSRAPGVLGLLVMGLTCRRFMRRRSGFGLSPGASGPPASRA